MANLYKVYKHTNKTNGKVYIGITKQTMERRTRGGAGYKSCTLFNKAIKKYGWDNFETTVLINDVGFETACELEKRLISEYASSDKRFGYNTMLGGQNQDGIPEETRKKISVSLTGRRASGETKAKQSKAHKGIFSGEKNPMYGKGMGKEKNPMYGMTRGKCPSSKKVIFSNGSFDCVADCAEYFGIGYSSMRAYLNGQRKMPEALFDYELRYAR